MMAREVQQTATGHDLVTWTAIGFLKEAGLERRLATHTHLALDQTGEDEMIGLQGMTGILGMTDFQEMIGLQGMTGLLGMTDFQEMIAFREKDPHSQVCLLLVVRMNQVCMVLVSTTLANECETLAGARETVVDKQEACFTKDR